MNLVSRLFSLIFAFSFLTYASALQAAVPVPAPPEVAAKNYILVDFASGQVLAEKDADTQVEPASITKLMTAYVVFNEMQKGGIENGDLVTISEKAWRMGGSRMFVEVGTKVSVEDLIKGMVIQSGNDATVALAEHIAGSETAFVQLMNQYAADLGMSSTNFMNSTGWPDEMHLTTARDISLLAAAMIRDFPEHYYLYKEKEFTYNNIKQYNRNKLLWRDESVDGIKTGHTESAGYCLVSSAERTGMRLVSVVLGTDSKSARASISQTVLNYGFRFFESHTLFTSGEALKRTRIWKGETEEVAVGLADDLSIAIPRGSYKQLEPVMDIDSNIEAPVSRGQQLGVVRVSLEGEVLETVPLVALETVERGNLLQVAKDYLLKMIE